jgi:hypothetical protein
LIVYFLQGTWPRDPSRISMRLCKLEDNVLNNNKKIKIAADIQVFEKSLALFISLWTFSWIFIKSTVWDINMQPSW